RHPDDGQGSGVRVLEPLDHQGRLRDRDRDRDAEDKRRHDPHPAEEARRILTAIPRRAIGACYFQNASRLRFFGGGGAPVASIASSSAIAAASAASVAGAA